MHTGARPLSPVETNTLLAAFDGNYEIRNRAIVQLGLHTGLRLSSILNLRVGDVFDGRRFYTRIHVARRNLKGRKAGLNMPFHPVARFAVGRWFVVMRRMGMPLSASTPLFQSREGGNSLSRRRAQEIIQEAAGRAGLVGVSTHSWRKTFASRLYEQTGHNLLLVSRALHHRQLSTSIHYLSWKLEEKADEAIMAL